MRTETSLCQSARRGQVIYNFDDELDGVPNDGDDGTEETLLKACSRGRTP